MQSANVLADRHQALAEQFTSLGQARGKLPVFAIEHGLDELALEELRKTVSRQIEEDLQLAGAVWSWSYLPLVVIATEVGYRYRGTGTDFWPVLSQEIGAEAGPAFRSGLSRLFELGHDRFRLAQPGDSPWERHFPHISWPIGNSVVPLEIQPQLADALRRAVRAGVPADDTERLLEYLRALAAGHASRRFENWLLQRDLALEVMRRLLAPESAGWLSQNFLLRIDRDIRKDWGALRAITEARKTVARRTARLAQIVPSRYVLALTDGAPSHLVIRGPALPAQLRDEVIAALRIHGDRIRAIDGMQALPLGSFLAGGEIALKSLFPFPATPLRRDDALNVDEGTANAAMERLQPLEPEFFAVESNDLTAHAVFPDDKLQPDSRIIQFIRADCDGNLETRTLETSIPSDMEFLRRRGFIIADRVPSLQLLGLPAPGPSNRFLGDFPVLVARRGVAGAELLLDGSVASGELLNIRGIEWKALRPDVGRHLIKPAEGRELDRLDFEVIEPPDVEPATVKLLPANANVSDLESGRLEIKITAPLALEAVAIRVRVISPNETAIVSQGVIERLPARITGRSPILHEIQTQLAGIRANETGLRLHVEAEGLLDKVFSLPPVRREIRFDGDTGKWIRTGEDEKVLASISASIGAPLLGAGYSDSKGTRLVLPDAPDHEALTAGMIFSGPASTRLGLVNRSRISLPALLREPTSSENGVGIIELARANVAWQLAEARDLLGNWQRWSVVEELEAALIEQLCGARWRRLETEIDPSFADFYSALLRFIVEIWDSTKGGRPQLDNARDRDFLSSRILQKMKEVLPDPQTAATNIDDDLAGALDLAMEDAYDELSAAVEARGDTPEFSCAVGFLTDDWRSAFRKAGDAQRLLMFRPYILPDARWSALVRPFYSELTEDDLVDLLDSVHVDAFRRPGLRWLGRPEIRAMLQLWLSPKAMVETEGWRELLAKGVSDIRTSRAVRYVALRRKLALGDLPDGSAS